MALYIDVLIREAFVSKLSLVLLARTQPVMVQGHVMRPTARERVQITASRKRANRHQNHTLTTMEAELPDKS